MTKPRVVSTKKPLPFGELSPDEFERLCLWLVKREGYLRPQHLGEAGHDAGRDVVAYKSTDEGEELWYFQCKRRKQIHSSTLKNDVDKYNELAKADEKKRPTGIVFVTSVSVRAGVRDRVAAYCEQHGYDCDFWARTELDMRVKNHPDIVEEFFDASSGLLERFVRGVQESIEALMPPLADTTRSTHLFISHRSQAETDHRLATELHRTLTAEGCDVFLDSGTSSADADWLEQVDRHIKGSDYLIVLLSKESVDSEMIRVEVSRASEYRKLQGKPHIIPVRIAYEGRIPYSIAAFLSPLQYVLWESEADNERVVQEVLAAMRGQLPEQDPYPTDSTGQEVNVSEDGRLIDDRSRLWPPLPEFDPRFLKELAVPGGAVRLSDRLYVEREADERLKTQIVKRGSTTTIRASRQTGKTSLLIRGMHHAHEQGGQVAFLDFQAFGSDQRTEYSRFLQELAGTICDELDLDWDNVERSWRGSRSAPRKLTRFVGKYVLPAFDEQVTLAMDEADSLLQTGFYKDFFGLLRSWHNRRASHRIWERLNLVLVISTEPYLLIHDVNQSPFNVGRFLDLKDFDAVHVRDLNQRHGSPVQEREFPQLMASLGGHPYLTRKALYTLVTEHWTWEDLGRMATADDGPFGDHLHSQYWLLREAPDLRRSLKEVVRDGSCRDETSFFRLLRAGLVKGSRDTCTCRCGLYEAYFKDRL